MSATHTVWNLSNGQAYDYFIREHYISLHKLANLLPQWVSFLLAMGHPTPSSPT